MSQVRTIKLWYVNRKGVCNADVPMCVDSEQRFKWRSYLPVAFTLVVNSSNMLLVALRSSIHLAKAH